MKTSIIIPTHNRLHSLRSLLEDLNVQVGVELDSVEVLIVDSEQGTDSEYLVKEFSAAPVCVRHIIAPNILASKRNAGALHAAGDLLIFLDDDMRIHENFVTAHINAHAGLTPGKAAAVSSQIAFPMEWVKRSNYYRYKHFKHRNAQSSSADQETIPGNQFVAMSFSILAKTYSELGGFDEEFRFYGGEDVEFGYRLSRFGCENLYSSAPLSYHEEVDMDIREYARKVYRATYFGTPMVLLKAPEASSVFTFRITEPSVSRAPHALLLRSAARAINLFGIRALITKYLEKTDGSAHFYLPVLYDIVVIAVVQLAVDDRRKGRTDRTLRSKPVT